MEGVVALNRPLFQPPQAAPPPAGRTFMVQVLPPGRLVPLASAVTAALGFHHFPSRHPAATLAGSFIYLDFMTPLGNFSNVTYGEGGLNVLHVFHTGDFFSRDVSASRVTNCSRCVDFVLLLFMGTCFGHTVERFIFWLC